MWIFYICSLIILYNWYVVPRPSSEWKIKLWKILFKVWVNILIKKAWWCQVQQVWQVSVTLYSWEGFLLKFHLWRVPYMNLAFSSEWSFVPTWITLILSLGFCNSCLSFPVYIEYLSTAEHIRKTVNTFNWNTNASFLNYVILYLMSDTNIFINGTR